MYRIKMTFQPSQNTCASYRWEAASSQGMRLRLWADRPGSGLRSPTGSYGRMFLSGERGVASK